MSLFGLLDHACLCPYDELIVGHAVNKHAFSCDLDCGVVVNLIELQLQNGKLIFVLFMHSDHILQNWQHLLGDF